jgi:hypothetical protein
LNDGTLHTEFTDDCDRVENGLQTTNNPNIEGYPIAAMGCADQFRQGQYIYDDRLRDRRFPLVDEEKGIVLAGGFIDHCGKVVDVTWTDGVTKTKSVFHFPAQLRADGDVQDRRREDRRGRGGVRDRALQHAFSLVAPRWNN